MYQWNCTITDARGVSAQLTDVDPNDQLDPLYLPIGTPIHMKVTNKDGFEDLDIEAPGARGHYPRRGGAGELNITLERAGSYTWKCPVQEPPGSAVAHQTTHTIIAQPAAEWAASMRAYDDAHDWTKPANLIPFGKKLYERKGCNACHTVDGSPRVGPSWRGIWGKSVTGKDGSTRSVDDAFVRESILSPQAFIADGFPPVMPSFEGQLKPREVAALVAYIQSLGAP